MVMGWARMMACCLNAIESSGRSGATCSGRWTVKVACSSSRDRPGSARPRCSRPPVMLVVDDVHWADRASLRFLAFLPPRLEERRAMVLLAARPAEAGASRELMAAITMDPATEVVTLRPLTTGGVARLVAAGLGSE